jgi:transcriptional regulator with XRE-family HTH domain
MKHTSRLGELVRTRRAGLGLTQRSLAQKLGVEASHVGFIETGRRKPSLKLAAQLADTLGLDGQTLLILTHPEAKRLITKSKPEVPPHAAPSWRKFIQNRELLASYDVTDRELQALEKFSSLRTIRSSKEFLAILMLIRDIPTIK